MADKLANTVSLLLEVLREKSVLIAAVVGESSAELGKTNMACFEVYFRICNLQREFGCVWFGLFGQVRIVYFKYSISLFEIR